MKKDENSYTVPLSLHFLSYLGYVWNILHNIFLLKKRKTITSVLINRHLWILILPYNPYKVS